MNAAMESVVTPLALVISSHTEFAERTGLERMRDAVANPHIAAVSIRYHGEDQAEQTITAEHLSESGIGFGSCYSNSLGLLRVDCWRALPFDERLNSVEDYAWAVAQIMRGYHVKRLAVGYHYRRNGFDRTVINTARVRWIANQNGLTVRWLGIRGAILHIMKHSAAYIYSQSARADVTTVSRRLRGWLRWNKITSAT